ncbi:MAG: FAD-dependent oxidoreductase [Bacteroidota bacterium]
MIREGAAGKREPRIERIESDLVVVGGGMSGVCCALTAARAGIQVTLVQDRPVLGGNASSEVRLWIMGATSNMGNNNRWAREGGVIDELLLENLYRNPEGNSVIFDTILLEKVWEEPNIRLLLNTTVYDVEKLGPDRIESVTGFCSQNSIKYQLVSSLFCDASGDGIVAFQAGAAFRMGAESRQEFDEGFAPDVRDYGELLGHSLYFQSKDAGKPVSFVPPAYALKNPEELAKIRNYNLKEQGCWLWWVEYGGRLDTVHQSEEIKWELWKVIYGIWDHVKNSGDYPEAENLTLEWVGLIPGKRESRRFEGDYILSQKDIVELRSHEDAVAAGGWSLDLHPADGVYEDEISCTQWHTKGIYQIPYRCYYSRNIENLFFAGRIISATHVAFGSSRVMATCAHGGQAVGMAAALATSKSLLPRDFSNAPQLDELQNRLNRSGQNIPRIPLDDPHNLARHARVTASTTLTLDRFPADSDWISLEDHSIAQMLPYPDGKTVRFSLIVDAYEESSLELEIRTSSDPFHHTPDHVIRTRSISLDGGEQEISIGIPDLPEREGYLFLCLMKSDKVRVRSSRLWVAGVRSLFNKENLEVSNRGRQEAPEGIGVESFEFWTPERRPKGPNLAVAMDPPLQVFAASNVTSGWTRPNRAPNGWVASPDEERPELVFEWDDPVTLGEVILFLDTDFDHPLESTIWGHSERVIPSCVRTLTLLDGDGNELASVHENHQTIVRFSLESAVTTNRLVIQAVRPDKHTPVAIYEVLCYGESLL